MASQDRYFVVKNTVISFPIAFPTSCLSVQLTTKRQNDSDGLDNVSGISDGPSQTQVTLTIRNDTNTTTFWLAIGY